MSIEPMRLIKTSNYAPATSFKGLSTVPPTTVARVILDVGNEKVEIMRAAVVLPAPFGLISLEISQA